MQPLILHSVLVTQEWAASTLALGLTKVHQAQKSLLICVDSRNKCFPTKLEFYLKKIWMYLWLSVLYSWFRAASAMIDLHLNTKTHL